MKIEFFLVRKGKVEATAIIKDDNWIIEGVIFRSDNGLFFTLPSQTYTAKDGTEKRKYLVKVNGDKSRLQKLNDWAISEYNRQCVNEGTDEIPF